MNLKDWAKSPLVEFSFRAASIVLLVMVLKTTGVIGAVSYWGQWAVMHSGLEDAGSESENEAEEFDFQFTIKDLNGKRYPFEKFKGKVIFLNVWAQWCGPCRVEMPGIQRLYEKTDTTQVAFVMLSIDRDIDLKKVTGYLQKEKFTFPAFMPSGYLPEQLKVPLIPTTFVISRSGKVERKEVGRTRFDTPKFEKFLNQLITTP